jgi:hypothetical protein
VRLRDFLARFQIIAAICQGELLAAAIGAHGLDRGGSSRQSSPGFSAQPEAWRHPVLKDFENHGPASSLDAMRLIVRMPVVAVSEPVAMAVIMVPSLQEHRAGNIHGKPETCNRYRLGKVDRNRREDAADGFVANQHRDHRKDNGTGETREIAELASPERKSRILGVPASVAIGKRREQQSAGMGAHVHAVGDESNRAKQKTADDLGDHHGSAEADHRPRPALVALVPRPQEYVGVPRQAGDGGGLHHGRLT